MRSLAVFMGAALVTLAFDSARAACGQVEVAKGDIKIQSGQTKTIEAAKVGSKICSGDTIIAEKDSRAKLKMEDGNELNISPESKIVLETYQYNPAENKKKVMLNILQGKVRAATKQENMYNDKAKDGAANTFQVRTKSAVAGVRGTDFLTGFDAKTKKTEVLTFKGQVEVGQLGPGGKIVNSVMVGAGQRSELAPGQRAAPPKPVEAGEFQQLNSDSKVDLGSNSGSGSAPVAGAAPGLSSGDDKKGSDQAKSPSPGGDRAPASAPASSTQPKGPSMIGADDLGKGDKAPVLPRNIEGTGPRLPPVISNNSNLPKIDCPHCIDAIQKGNTKVNLRVRIEQ